MLRRRWLRRSCCLCVLSRRARREQDSALARVPMPTRKPTAPRATAQTRAWFWSSGRRGLAGGKTALIGDIGARGRQPDNTSSGKPDLVVATAESSNFPIVVRLRILGMISPHSAAFVMLA